MPNNNNKTNKVAVSFDEMIQADRKKRKAEQLAQEIFGKNRRTSAPAAGANKKNNQTPVGGSLASRVGVTKNSAQPRAIGLSNERRQNTSDSHNNNSNNNRSQPGRNHRRPLRDPALNAAAKPASRAGQLQAPVAQASAAQGKQAKAPFDGEISIRGAAGPYCVVASNFAPGTTSADIESVMAPIGGQMLGCKLVTDKPTVIVEMVFVERSGAENVIAMFNNKKADGRLLYVYLKESGPSHPVTTSSILSTTSHPAHTRPIAKSAIVPPVPSPHPAHDLSDDVMELDPGAVVVNDAAYINDLEVDTDPNMDAGARSDARDGDHRPARDAYRPPPRDDRPSYRNDYPRGPRNAVPEVQDGRYGFQDPQYPRHGSGGGGGGYGGAGYQDDRRGRFRDNGRMYSDSMAGRRGGGGGGGAGRAGPYRR